MAAARARVGDRARLLPELAAVIAVAWGLYALLTVVRGPAGSLLAFSTLVDRAADDPWYRFLWLIINTNDAQFYSSIFGGIALVAGAFAAWRLERVESRWQGFAIAAGTGLWPQVFAASLLGLAISVVLYGSILEDGAWIPTFVPFVSIPAGVVLMYGPGWRNLLTGAILGGIIGFPIAYAVIELVLNPIEFPAVIGNVTGMWLGGIIVFELCHRVLPWMRTPHPPPETELTGQPVEAGTPVAQPIDRPGWLARRTLADFTEAQFYGNEIASAALLGGLILTWLLDSAQPVYGTGLLPSVLAGQVMVSALGIMLYHGQWRRLEWYPTFVPVVSVVPAVVLTYGGGAAPILAGTILGVLLGPPIAQFGIDRIPGHWHPFVANTFAMAVATAIAVAVLIPFPGFDLPS
jgi:hypothetical protein